MINQLKEINERFGDDYCDNIAPECFNLIIKSVILADKYTEKEKASIIKQFSDEVITVSDVLNGLYRRK